VPETFAAPALLISPAALPDNRDFANRFAARRIGVVAFSDGCARPCVRSPLSRSTRLAAGTISVTSVELELSSKSGERTSRDD
jgi:hypothetical protein